ncbi:MAG: matrixin family metalloprotease [Leptonema sp. (in: Bacteria)]|nr:matrixin family metalloprotease [Leptonema sp. (in: bacteria)]
MRFSFWLFILVELIISCARSATIDENYELIGLVRNIEAVAVDSPLIQRAEIGLNEWQIGLNTKFRSRFRNAGGDPGSYDPPNWLAISDRNCLAMGVPYGLRQNCPLSNAAVLGVCQIVNSQITGEILNTTILIARDFQLNDSVALDERISVLTHEIGHCLGLTHSNTNSDIMYPDLSGANHPSVGELAAIQSSYIYYIPPVDASRFDKSQNGNVLRHFREPAFFLYDGESYESSTYTMVESVYKEEGYKEESNKEESTDTQPIEVKTYLFYK